MLTFFVITRTKTSIRYAKENDREKREREKGRRRDIEREGEINEVERKREIEREGERERRAIISRNYDRKLLASISMTRKMWEL